MGLLHVATGCLLPVQLCPLRVVRRHVRLPGGLRRAGDENFLNVVYLYGENMHNFACATFYFFFCGKIGGKGAVKAVP